MCMWFTVFIAVSIDWIFFLRIKWEECKIVRLFLFLTLSVPSFSLLFQSNGKGKSFDVRSLQKIEKKHTFHRDIEFCDFAQKISSLHRSSIHAWWFVYINYTTQNSQRIKKKGWPIPHRRMSLNRYVYDIFIGIRLIELRTASNTHLNIQKRVQAQ